jgi:hypothetical protein
VIAVYLDSSDFSDLSTRREKPDDEALLTTLIASRREKLAVFPLSPIHLSEAVHHGPGHRDAAVRRAELMKELCGTSMLRYPTEILRMEVERALNHESPPVRMDAFSGPGEFFGMKFDFRSLRSVRAERESEIRTRISESGWPRRERRRLLAQLDLSRARSKDTW